MITPITHTGMTHPRNSSSYTYGKNHLSDFMDVWLPNTTIGIDHIFYEDETVELRVKGFLLEDLP